MPEPILQRDVWPTVGHLVHTVVLTTATPKNCAAIYGLMEISNWFSGSVLILKGDPLEVITATPKNCAAIYSLMEISNWFSGSVLILKGDPLEVITATPKNCAAIYSLMEISN